ncbi:MAG: ChbG/HpnK family deacetylase [Pseudopedobacter sp.]|nr:ChbG/HpnK family deacetylase [Deinococcales bacterium]
MHPLFQNMGLENQKVLIWHHDDLGMTRGHNAAFLELAGKNHWTTGSIIFCGEFAEDIARAVGQDPAFDVGVHLAIAGDFVPLTFGESLRDVDGRMWRSSEEAWSHLTVPDAEAEMRAQIERALELNVDITHLDSHMGTVFRPDILTVYLRLGFEFRVPVMLPRASNFPLPDAIKTLLGQIIESSPLPTLDRVVMGWEIPVEQKKAWYLEQLESLEPGIYPFLHHAARATGENIWPGDVADFEAFQDPDVVAALGECRHLTYREVRDAMRSSL